MLNKLDKMLEEFVLDDSNDFGFSGISSDEYNAKIQREIGTEVKKHTQQSSEKIKDKIYRLEQLIMPFLIRLRDTGDKEYIYWPNRKTIIEAHILDILEITREQ